MMAMAVAKGAHAIVAICFFWKLELTYFNDDTNRRCSQFTSGQGTNNKISDKREMAKDYEKRFTCQCH